MKRLVTLFSMVVVFAFGGVAAVGAQPGPNNPGSPGDNCSHGNANKPCKDDPQPDRGKDCLDHGKARGNEDHCGPGDDDPPPTGDEPCPDELEIRDEDGICSIPT
jgi:hypothetical protein